MGIPHETTIPPPDCRGHSTTQSKYYESSVEHPPSSPTHSSLRLSQWPRTDNYCSGISWWLLFGGSVPPLAAPSDINESFLLTGNHVVEFMANWPASLNTTLWSIDTHYVDSSGAPSILRSKHPHEIPRTMDRTRVGVMNLLSCFPSSSSVTIDHVSSTAEWEFSQTPWRTQWVHPNLTTIR